MIITKYRLILSPVLVISRQATFTFSLVESSFLRYFFGDCLHLQVTLQLFLPCDAMLVQ